MRASILATIFAFGSVIAVPAVAQQSTGTSSQQQMQDEADKGIKTRNSGSPAMWENKKSRVLLAMFPANRIRKATRQRRGRAAPSESLEV